jgi:hypothetical protein
MSNSVYHNVLSQEDISALIEFYKDKPDAATESYVINKNFEYHIPEDFSYQLLHNKLEKILGPHEFDTGAYKECLEPYPLHSDSPETHLDLGTITSFGHGKKLNLAVLIPLVEGDEFCTVVFDCYSNQDLITKRQSAPNQLAREDFGHCLNMWQLINHLPVTDVYKWRLGDVLVWDRQQYHISADFARHSLVKKFLIMFVV